MKLKPLAAALLFALPACALAQQQPPQLETFEFHIGAFWPKIETVVQANGSQGQVGTTINFESELGFADSRTLPIFDASWRFAQRHRLMFDFVKLDRNASTTASGEIRFGDTVFPVNAQLNSTFDSEIYALSYLYSLYQDKESELAIGLGIDYTKLTAGISSAVLTQSLSSSKSASAPLPVLVLQGSTKFADQWSASLKFDWFGIKYGDYDGSLNVASAAVQYFPVKNWGIEGGYSYYKYRLDITKSDWNGNANYKFYGPTLSLVGRF